MTKKKLNLEVDKFLKNSKKWKNEITKLREIILKTDLEENFKWNLPCYSYKEKNIVIIQPFKTCLGLMFFKGKLLKDQHEILIDNGPNSQAARRFEFTSVQGISESATTIKTYIKEAIAIEESGKKIEFKKEANIPDELKKFFMQKPKIKKAFYLLTPGRQRAYVLYFSGAKQASTRQSRIEKYLPRILACKGLND